MLSDTLVCLKWFKMIFYNLYNKKIYGKCLFNLKKYLKPGLKEITPFKPGLKEITPFIKRKLNTD